MHRFAPSAGLTLSTSQAFSRFLQLLLFLFTSVVVADDLPLTEIHLGGPPGPYSVDQWKKDWPGCAWQDGVAEGNVSLVSRDGATQLRVDYQPGKIGPEENGCGWRFPIGSRESAEMRYTVRFSAGFDWVKGGKLPGLCGGPRNVSGGRPADGHNGFSARLMWRADGRGEAYLYHLNQPDRYGDRVPFPPDFRFPTDTAIHVRMQVVMNEPGRKNGKIQIWIRHGDDEKTAEREVVHRTDLAWRSVATFGIDSLYFETFHGGSDISWSPQKPSWGEFGRISVR